MNREDHAHGVELVSAWGLFVGISVAVYVVVGSVLMYGLSRLGGR